METVIIDNVWLAGALESTEACGNLLVNESITTIYVKTGEVNDNLNSFVKTLFPNSQALTSGDYSGYTQYTK